MDTRTMTPEALTSAALAPRIAVILPCYNEGAAIAQTIRSFRDALPGAVIFVYDNASSDDTSAVAAAHGATVRLEHRRGKGNVVRRMLADVDADIYVLADGDGTYDAESAPDMIRLLRAGQLDVINGARVEQARGAYRAGHRFGNWMLSTLVRLSFSTNWRDMLSGYKVMSRRFVKSFPIASRGFEIETELLIHAMEIRAATAEHSTLYHERAKGSVSKLNTFRDGFRILRMITRLVKDERPLQFFSGVALLLIATALGLAWPVFLEYARTGLVPRLPTAVLATGLSLAGLLALLAGFILDGLAAARREAKMLAYLQHLPPPPVERA